MKKLYAIVINSIDKSYQGVQLGHITGVMASENPDINWNEQTFVYLKANEKKIYKTIDKLIKNKIQWQKFHEPDIGNKMTAIACITDQDNIFKSFDLF